MSRVEVSQRELAKAFWRHCAVAQTCEGPSSLLLKFYAVECGLKSRYMMLEKMYSTQKMVGTEFGTDGHNLSAGARACRIPAHACPSPDKTGQLQMAPSLRRSNGSEVAAHQAHQAWRYGADIEDAYNKKYDAWLTGIAEWLKINGDL